ncbi:MAG: PEP-CTERM sorting domain-containing protein [Myxococcales bacterium]|nr:PEP-CTERM sorting domain-containing protein [Myxococcales bacterium]
MRAFRCIRSRSLLIAVALSTFAGAAQAGTITFDEPLLALVHGEVVDTDFAGVTIRAVNPNKSFDLAVVFDTTRMGTSDPDLEDPFTAGNAAGETLGNALIVAENDTGCGDDVCNDPDDEGPNPPTLLGFVLEFTGDVESFSLTAIDLESAQAAGGSLTFFDDGAQVGQVFFSEFECAVGPYCDPTVDFAGDHSANRLPAVTAAALGLAGFFDEVHIDLNGSGAIDELAWTPVPEPATLWLLAAGFFALRRRATPRG